VEPGLRIHLVETSSRANGPGLRAVVWVQGCSLGCPGCFNPETHPAAGGIWIPVGQLVDEIICIPGIEGISVSGGEPFQQASALAAFLRSIKEKSQLSVLVFSGFTWDEIARIPRSGEILANIDILLAGRYQAENRLARGLLGSSNKEIYFLNPKYSAADLEAIPDAEILIKPDGTLISTGINPLG